ncbi:MAG: PQQ-binding-like beta-propeller repeat protein [Acidobacteriota bacterium]
MMDKLSSNRASLLALLVAVLLTAPAVGGEWPHWRGPSGNSVSAETGLISSWSKDGDNLLWRVDFTGRSTPVVAKGRVCVTGRVGEGVDRQERAACFDATTGKMLWERRFNVYHTTVPWTRVGWANPTLDPETGLLYVQGVGGLFFCLDSKDGRIVWSKSLIEEFGFMEGYGGRTQTPVIDEERVIITFASTNWGAQARPLHRMYAFDKRNGEPIWASSPASSMADKNTQSTPAIAEIDGQRLLIQGNGGGSIFAVQSRTGKKVWEFKLSKRGINISVVVDGSTVYASHSEENLDAPNMGRVVAIDATGEGDITASHEKWRAAFGVGFSSPLYHQGRLYVVDNKADLHALDAKTGQQLWEYSLGTVGKASPVWADGKLWIAEVNGRMHILEPGDEGARSLDLEELHIGERYAEIYGSVAISDGRIYFTTEEGLYCLGKQGASETLNAAPVADVPTKPISGKASQLQALPAETVLGPGDVVALRLRSFDAKGNAVGETTKAEWSLDGLQGTLEGHRFRADPEVPYQAGLIVAKVGDLTASARVRVVADLPYSEDFEGLAVGSKPVHQIAYLRAWAVEEREGGKVLAKNPSPAKLNRHLTFLAPPTWSNYTIQADALGTRTGRRLPDIGLINSGYSLDLMGAHQRLEVRSWASALRMAEKVDFSWDPETWYTLKLKVESTQEEAKILGKVWKRGEPEPAEWTITVVDPHPIRQGSPGLIGYSPTPLYYDNVEVTEN